MNKGGILLAVHLLMTTAVILACILFNKISSKLGVPTLLAFILLGMFFGSDGVVNIPFDNFAFSEQICSVALIFIMFYGGFGTKWSEARPIAVKSMLLSTMGVLLTAGITGLFCYYVLHFPLLESLLLGSVISSTDAASVFSILRSKRLNLKYNTASMLEVESGSNDPFSYMLTVIMLTIMEGSASAGNIIYMIFAQIGYAILLALLTSVAALYFLKKFHFASAGFDAIFILAVALFSYAAPAAIGGNGFLSTYIVGIILGNRAIKNKKALVYFFDCVTGMMQMLIFFLLGLLSFPSQLPKIMVPALLIALFLTFVARPIAVFSILGPFRCKLNQLLLVSWSGLRGAASIVFSIMAAISPVYTGDDVYHIVFFIVLFSILIQGSLIPLVAKKLDMVDARNDVLKTFSDYSSEIPIRFIHFTVPGEHPWSNRVVKDILLPPETLLILLIRKSRRMIPNGDTVILPDDELIMSATSTEDVGEFRLSEVIIDKRHEFIGKTVAELPLEPGKLIMMIQRKGRTIIPQGNTEIRSKDVLVINETD